MSENQANQTPSLDVNDQETMRAVVSMLLQGGRDETLDQYRSSILSQIAGAADVRPSRIPAPLNITEVGGYFNLIDQVETTDPALQNEKARMQLALIASALGLPT